MLIISDPVSADKDRTACGNGLSYTHSRDSVSVLTADLLDTLEWKVVTVINAHQNHSGVLELDLLLSKLHLRGVQTLVLENRQQLNETLLPTISDAGGFLVLGSFKAVARLANETDGLTKLFHDEWVTVIDKKNVFKLEHSIRNFENVVIIAEEQNHVSLWTLLRSGDVSHVSFVTSLAGDLPKVTRPQILPNPSYRLGGRTLKVAFREVGYQVFSVNKNGTKVYQGILIDLLHELCLRLNFTYVIVEAPDNNYGKLLDNGQWNGLIGMLTRKEIDIAVTGFRLTSQRAAVVDPSAAYSYDDSRIVFRKPQRGAVTNTWSFFFRSFQAGVFTVIGASFMAVLALLLLCEASHYWWISDHQRAPKGRDLLVLLIVDGVEILLAGLVNRPSREPASRAGHWLVCAWLLLGVVLASVYSSKLTATLTVTEQGLPFSTMAELVYKQFYKGVLEFAESDPSVLSPVNAAHKQKVFAGNYAVLLGSTKTYEKWHEENCEIAMTKGVGMKKTEVFYLQKGSPHTSLISSEIERIVEAGLVSHWTEKWSQKTGGQCGDDEEEPQRAIRLSEVQTAFYLAGAGVGLAVLTLGLECLVRRELGSAH
ncbi:hypothetical protein BaRGS_00015435 [Batillaria attramentaria]|uniref:Uncharacterized protein n=1 Tax=Batillaria attramentaria TaxID=370345 RepID=A0ABD0L1M8_9CAEN